MRGGIERAGEFYGEHVLRPAAERIRRHIEQYEVECFGVEHLRALGDNPYILAPNHVRPSGILRPSSGLASDAFIFERVVKEETGRELRIVAKCDDGWLAGSARSYFQKHVSQPFGQAATREAGFLPVKKNPGSFNRDFLKAVDLVVGAHEPILIFPEGDWHREFRAARPLEPGAAFIALRHNLPIVPGYIEGCAEWTPREPVQVAFGAPLSTEEMTRDELTERLRSAIEDLQREVRGMERER